jgi:hypothetical protein
MVIAHGKFGGQSDAVTGPHPKVQSGWMILAAAEAVPVMRGDLLAGRRGVRVARRDNGMGGRLGAATTHSADPTYGVGAAADRLPTVEAELTHSERLWPPWPWWVVGTAFIATLAWAYGYATRAWVGWLVFGIGTALYAWWLARAAVRIEVGPDGLHAAGAHLTPEYLGVVTALNRDDAARLRGVAADPSAFLVLRGWIPTAVRVDVNDPDDPVPYWYVSTRRPEDLMHCLSGLRPEGPTAEAD